MSPVPLGYVVHELPQDYTGERHVAVLRVVGRDDYGREWCEVEERTGPAPQGSAEQLPQACFTDTQMKICFGPDSVWPWSERPDHSDTEADSINIGVTAMKRR